MSFDYMNEFKRLNSFINYVLEIDMVTRCVKFFEIIIRMLGNDTNRLLRNIERYSVIYFYWIVDQINTISINLTSIFENTTSCCQRRLLCRLCDICRIGTWNLLNLILRTDAVSIPVGSNVDLFTQWFTP